MGKAAGKIVLNAALGFDSFVVMRQGLPATQPGELELGCYFCNDVVAPADVRAAPQPPLPLVLRPPLTAAVRSRTPTLDQQCTVTRPGVAPLASALAVELLVSVLQHPAGARAPPSSDGDGDGDGADAHPLGALPHTLRGSLATFRTLALHGQPYDCCAACSPRIVARYRDHGWAFVHRALTEPGWVEDVSGLREVQLRADQAAADVEWSDDDAEDDDGEMV